VQAGARVKKVEVRRQFAPALPCILANPDQIQQVVINLANNALDAMPEGGTLTVQTELLQNGALSWACLKVVDTGAGIPSEVLPNVFEPFFTTKPAGKGTGLGLSLVYEIVQKHSALIDVQSEPGHTEFRVKFPVRAAIS
jgi:signal transduction histidine kinase